ncbi:MAG: hypothetical protein JO112_08840 [Planctomycetes bacterium]|nr:hypothetical protein [Planctomycetota bacterium]
MARLILAWALLIMGTALAGCADDDHDSDINQLWRQGYGFHNPNYQRLKNGQKPLNFDGSE